MPTIQELLDHVTRTRRKWEEAHAAEQAAAREYEQALHEAIITEGVTFRDIGDAAGVNIGTVHKKLSRKGLGWR